MKTNNKKSLASNDDLDFSFNSMTWSYSRRETLESCPRRYYFDYYGSNSRTAKEEPNKSHLRKLKNIQNRFERSGFVLHLALSTYLKKYQQNTIMTEKDLIKWSKSILLADISLSKKYLSGENIENILSVRFPPTLLNEYYYLQTNADDLLKDSLQRIEKSITNFFNAPDFKEFRISGTAPEALVEQHLKIPDFPCKVDGRLDLAFKKNEQVYIVDWKMSYSDGSGDDSLQLAAYALWALNFFKIKSEKISVFKAYLLSGDIIEFSVTDNILSSVKARILQDVDRFLFMHKYGQSSISSAFTPCNQEAICNLCSYKEICKAEGDFKNA